MNLERSELLRAYRIMKMIREFEERIHLEFAKPAPPLVSWMNRQGVGGDLVVQSMEGWEVNHFDSNSKTL